MLFRPRQPIMGEYMPAGYPPKVTPVGPNLGMGAQMPVPPQMPGAAMPEMTVANNGFDPDALRQQLIGSANAAVPLPDVPRLSFAPPPRPQPVAINLSNLDKLMLSMYGHGQIGQGATPMSSTRPAYIPEGYRLNTTSTLSDPHMGTWDTRYNLAPIGGSQYTYPLGGGPLFRPR